MLSCILRPRLLVVVAILALHWPSSSAALDCNHNGTDDVLDIDSASSEDCNGNQVPDECESAPVRFGLSNKTYTLDQSVRSLKSGDMDRDGDLDVVAAASSSVTVFLNDGVGDFSLAGSHETPDRLIDLTLHDLDNDGDLDVATSCGEAACVFLNQGDGTLSQPTTYRLPATGSLVVAADLNGDDLAEIILPARRMDHLLLLEGSVEGGYGPPVEVSLAGAPDAATDMRKLLAVDLDLDGDLDLAGLDRKTDTFVTLLNNGNGTLGAPSRYPAFSTFSSSSTLAAADLNGDDFPELTARHTTAISILPNLGTGDALFGEVRSLSVRPATIHLADADADGDKDIIYSTTSPRTMSVRLNNGNGEFFVGFETSIPAVSSRLTFGDFDNDRILDFAFSVSSRVWRVAFGGVHDSRAFELVGENIPLTACADSRGCRPHSGDVGDIDGDGDIDVVGCNTHPGSFSIALNEAGRLIPQKGYTFGGNTATTGEHPQSVALGDVDGDSDLDAVTVDNHSHDFWLHRNRGDGSFQPAVRTGIGGAPINVRLGDLDQDGDLDGVSANQSSNSVSVLYNDGTGKFAAGATRDFRVGSSPKAVTLNDLDGDGHVDIAAANSGTTTITWLRNTGERNFESVTNITVGGTPNHIESDDIDQDGDFDLLTANTNRRTISVLLNDGKGNFAAPSDFSTDAGPYSLTIVDYDGNGVLDIITANELPETASTLSILTGNGDGTYNPAFNFLVPKGPTGTSGPRFVSATDLEDDGVVELITMNRGGQSFTLVRNLNVRDSSYLEAICTAGDYYYVAARSQRRNGIERLVKYTIPLDESPTALPTLFQNTRVYPLHENFLREVFPDQFPALDSKTYQRLTGERATRQYFVGTISRLLTPAGAVYGFSVYADFSTPEERLSMAEVGALRDRLAQSFRLEPLGYFPESRASEEVARSWVQPSFPIYFGADGAALSFEAYTRGVGYGRVRILDKEEFEVANESGTLSFQDVVVLEEAPRDILGVVGGVVTAQRQGPLSHVSVRTARRGTPNCFSGNALEEFSRFEGKIVRLQVLEANFIVEEAPVEKAEAFWDAIRQELSVPPTVDGLFGELSSFEEIASMENAGTRIVPRFGGKASNLAMLQTILTGTFAEYRESGFGIPARYYLEFMRSNRLPSALNPNRQVSYENYVAELLDDDRFQSDSGFRFQTLETLRSHIRNQSQVDPRLIDRLAQRIGEILQSPDTTRVRFRSSSNMEDAIEFNGAGLYASTSACRADDLDGDDLGPSHCDPDRSGERTIARALKRVWASLWNFGAFEERGFYRIDQHQAAMAVLVNRTFIDESVNGVAFTGNPSNSADRRYIVTAQQGEESVVSPEPGVLAEKNVVTLVDGKVVDVLRAARSSRIPEGSYVLSEAQLHEIGELLFHIDQTFPIEVGSHDRADVLFDIEFKIESTGELAVKQVRPFLITGPPLPNPTFELEIPPGSVACGQFRIGRHAHDEYELKSMLHFVDGHFALPTRDGSFQANLIDRLVFGQDRHVGKALGPGEFVVNKTILTQGVVDYVFDYRQEFEIEHDEPPLELNIAGLKFSARDGEPLSEALVLGDRELTHDLFLEGEIREEKRRKDHGVVLTFSSCEQESLPLFEIFLKLGDGTRIALEERLDPVLAVETDFSPASLVYAQVEMGEEVRRVASYWNLVYSADKHNEHLEYWVVLDPPMPAFGLSEAVHAVEIVPRQPEDPTVHPGVSYLGEDFTVIATRHIFEQLDRPVTGPRFRRGDTDANGAVELVDVRRLLEYLFLNAPKLDCQRAADVNDDGFLQLTDAILIVLRLFYNSGPFSLPADFCGRDQTPDVLSCETFTPCSGR